LAQLAATAHHSSRPSRPACPAPCRQQRPSPATSLRRAGLAAASPSRAAQQHQPTPAGPIARAT
jgi:hypothetical protein